MAQNQAPAFFFMALLLLAAAAPPAHAQLTPIVPQPLTPIVPQLLRGIIVRGVLPCPGGGGLAGVNVTLSCRIAAIGSGSGSLVVGQAMTGANGQFNMSLLNITGLLNTVGGTVSSLLAGDLPCVVSVRTPVAQIVCPAISGINGLLVGVLGVLGTAIGNILSFTVRFAVVVPV